MKFRVERDALADSVAWTAKSLPSRPSVPVLAGEYCVTVDMWVVMHEDARGTRRMRLMFDHLVTSLLKLMQPAVKARLKSG